MILMKLPSGFNWSEAILDYNVYELTFTQRSDVEPELAEELEHWDFYGTCSYGGWVGTIYDCKTGTTVWISKTFRSRAAAILTTEERLQKFG